MIKRFFKLIILILFVHPAFSQDDLEAKAKEIVQKATLIYELEKASWIAIDLNEKNNFRKEFESYISYKNNDSIFCVFYSNTDSCLTEYAFKNLDTSPTQSHLARKCRESEINLIKIKRNIKNKLATNAIKNVRLDKGSFNFIPVIVDSSIVCYLINTNQSETKLTLGRDYIIELDKDLNIIAVTGNHKSSMEIPFIFEAKNFSHTHILTHGFAVTEIATLMLYKPYLKIKEFVVYSKFYTSIWNNDTNSLIIK